MSIQLDGFLQLNTKANECDCPNKSVFSRIIQWKRLVAEVNDELV